MPLITDQDTNMLFLADCLPRLQPKFFKCFEKVLDNYKIPLRFIVNTKDIWAVDFMPVQIQKNRFVRFTYNPDYLQPKKYRKTISEIDAICATLGAVTHKSPLVIDGGNIVKSWFASSTITQSL
ncbi:MAG: hypothetical protein JSR44_06680 [Spirochaetes bacterium]|nr:hypothetical protein [Spirochaetota bacterium]